MQGIAQKVLMDPSRYSLAQLQQAVENGVLPAYIGIPIIQEKVQQQKMAQGAGQPPEGPPIAQQIMQQAQAAQGVEALPTNLPQEYATGGIVAFADGGDVERYQSGGLKYGQVQGPDGGVYETPYDRMNRLNREEEERLRQYLATPEGRAAQIRGDRAGLMALPAAAGDVLLGGPWNAIATGTTALANAVGVPRLGRALGIYSPDVTSVEVPRVGSGTATPFFDQLRQYAAGQQPPTAPKGPTNTDLGPVPGTSDKTSILGGIADARTGAMAPAAAGPGAARPPAVGTPGLGLKVDRPTFKAPEGESYADMAGRAFSDFATRANNRDVEAESKKEAARGKVQGQAFDEYKKALEQEALDAGADKQQAKYMSLFKAGLAMMGGTSRHALENIGKGAMVGAEDYQSALKDLKKADKERRKEFAHIEAARRAEAIGDRDTAIREIDAARDRGESRDRYVNEGIYKAQGMDKAQQYDISKTQFSSDSDLAKTDLAGRYSLAAADRSADAKLAAALARAGGRGGMNQKQIGDALLQLQTHPEAVAERKRLLKIKGSKAEGTPEFKDAMDKFVMGLFNKYYGGQIGADSGGGYSQADLSLVQRYLGNKQ